MMEMMYSTEKNVVSYKNYAEQWDFRDFGSLISNRIAEYLFCANFC